MSTDMPEMTEAEAAHIFESDPGAIWRLPGNPHVADPVCIEDALAELAWLAERSQRVIELISGNLPVGSNGSRPVAAPDSEAATAQSANGRPTNRGNLRVGPGQSVEAVVRQVVSRQAASS